MTRYILVHNWGATVVEEVKAESPEEAVGQSSAHPSLCHQCTDDVELGECISTMVSDMEGNELLPAESWHEKCVREKLEAAEAERDDLKRKLNAIYELWGHSNPDAEEAIDLLSELGDLLPDELYEVPE